MLAKSLFVIGISQLLQVQGAYYPPNCGPWPAGAPEIVNGVKRPPYYCVGGPKWPPEQPVVSTVTSTSTIISTFNVQLPPKTVTETTEAPPKTKTVTETEELPPKTRTIIETETLPAQTKTVIETETLPPKTKTLTETEQLPPKTKIMTETETTTLAAKTTTETTTLPAKTTTETETLPAKTVYQVAPTELAHAAANQCASWFTDGSRPVPVFDLDGQPQCCLPHPDANSKIFGDCHTGPRV
ncbi:hypothetical protein IFR05_012447 [Cadophora sp. M221]|nr:hypothetical protein IFR05_012447 [Cadophora sp. M221]